MKIIHPLWVGPRSYAFVSDDFTFFTDNEQQVTVFTPTSITTIAYVIIRFRKQKNNRNYEAILYYRDKVNPTFCPVAAAIRIHLRAVRLKVKPEEPLGVFHSTTGKYVGTRGYI